MRSQSQEHPAVPAAVDQGSTCDTRRWRAADRAGADGRREEAIRMLSELGWSRHAIAAWLGLSVFTVARAQRAGGAS
jgi:hypothetical protein